MLRMLLIVLTFALRAGNGDMPSSLLLSQQA